MFKCRSLFCQILLPNGTTDGVFIRYRVARPGQGGNALALEQPAPVGKENLKDKEAPAPSKEGAPQLDKDKKQTTISGMGDAAPAGKVVDFAATWDGAAKGKPTEKAAVLKQQAVAIKQQEDRPGEDDRDAGEIITLPEGRASVWNSSNIKNQRKSRQGWVWDFPHNGDRKELIC